MIHVPTARFIDRVAGGALCEALHFLGRFTGRLTEPLPLSRVERILIIKFWGLGNLIQATPAFRAVRRAFPDARITFLTLARNRGVFDNYPHFDEIIYMRDHSISAVFGEFLGLPLLLRSRRAQLALDLDPIGRFCALMTWLSGAGIRVGFSMRGGARERLYTRTVNLDESRHVRHTFLDLLGVVNISNGDMELDPVPVDGAVEHAVDRLLEQAGVAPGERLAAVNVNASDMAFERRWPPERFAEVADRMVAECGVRVLMVGAPEEVGYVDAVMDLMKQPAVNMAGRTSLTELAEVLRRCRVFLSNDSGPLHLAQAMGTPVVGLFGPETPARYGPLGAPHRVFAADIPCAPCISFRNEKQVNCTHDAACMKSIPAEDVWPAVRDILDRPDSD